ncbi:MFS transporter [Streptomyces sp. J2-1]|uniref:MFS transporter n=1 Tax=Streptomyces corallincola TaxID=2851888 RepID=UPI001C38A7B1|nr:MFS transporter [Streptomyces corallincola]MBV2353294.1 MFS transporter [Streptomyces corallincola]
MSAPASARPAAPSYAAVLRVPHARRAFAAALTARLSYGTVSIALLLSVTRATGSYAASGLVLALFGATAVLLMPLRAGLVDRYGPRRALPPMATVYGVLLGLLAVLTWRTGASVAPVAVTAVLAGACAPPLGPVMRALWSALIGDPDLLRRAFSLDGVAEELLFVSGPLLVGALLTTAPPPAGLLLSAVLVVGGTCAFAGCAGLGGTRPGSRRAGGGRVRGLLAPVAVAAGAGLALSAVELLATAFAAGRVHNAALVPWMLGALSAGSAVGGLLNGAVRWRSAARVRLGWFAAALGAVIAAAGFAPGPWSLTAAMACAGVFVAPALTTAYLLADEHAPHDARSRAGAWVNAAVNAGSSTGAVGIGLLIGHLPLTTCFALAGVTALASAPLAWSARSRPTQPAPAAGL